MQRLRILPMATLTSKPTLKRCGPSTSAISQLVKNVTFEMGGFIAQLVGLGRRSGFNTLIPSPSAQANSGSEKERTYRSGELPTRRLVAAFCASALSQNSITSTSNQIQLLCQLPVDTATCSYV